MKFDLNSGKYYVFKNKRMPKYIDSDYHKNSAMQVRKTRESLNLSTIENMESNFLKKELFKNKEDNSHDADWSKLTKQAPVIEPPPGKGKKKVVKTGGKTGGKKAVLVDDKDLVKRTN